VIVHVERWQRLGPEERTEAKLVIGNMWACAFDKIKAQTKCQGFMHTHKGNVINLLSSFSTMRDKCSRADYKIIQ
jgi:hypothetical protein